MEEFGIGIQRIDLMEEFNGRIRWRDIGVHFEHGGASIVDVGTHYPDGK